MQARVFLGFFHFLDKCFYKHRKKYQVYENTLECKISSGQNLVLYIMIGKNSIWTLQHKIKRAFWRCFFNINQNRSRNFKHLLRKECVISPVSKFHWEIAHSKTFKYKTVAIYNGFLLLLINHAIKISRKRSI